MPGFYNSTQVRYFKEIEKKINEKNAKKQEYLDNIRNRAYEKTHVDIGKPKPNPGGKPKGISGEIFHGVPGYLDEPGVAESK